MAQIAGVYSGHEFPNGFGDPRWTPDNWCETIPYRVKGEECEYTCTISGQEARWCQRKKYVVCEWHHDGCPGGAPHLSAVNVGKCEVGNMATELDMRVSIVSDHLDIAGDTSDSSSLDWMDWNGEWPLIHFQCSLDWIDLNDEWPL